MHNGPVAPDVVVVRFNKFRFIRPEMPDAALRSLLGIVLNGKPLTYNMLILPDQCA